MINMNNTHRLAAAALATITMLGLGGTTVSASTEPPTIDQIGAQYVSETGATSVACSQYDADVICYGLLDGAVIAGVWADGVFTPFGDLAEAASTEAPTGAPTGVTLDHPDAFFARFYVSTLEPDLDRLCPMWEADPQGTLDSFRETITVTDTLSYTEVMMQWPDITATADEMEDMIVLAFNDRLVTDCA